MAPSHSKPALGGASELGSERNRRIGDLLKKNNAMKKKKPSSEASSSATYARTEELVAGCGVTLGDLMVNEGLKYEEAVQVMLRFREEAGVTEPAPGKLPAEACDPPPPRSVLKKQKSRTSLEETDAGEEAKEPPKKDRKRKSEPGNKAAPKKKGSKPNKDKEEEEEPSSVAGSSNPTTTRKAPKAKPAPAKPVAENAEPNPKPKTSRKKRKAPPAEEEEHADEALPAPATPSSSATGKTGKKAESNAVEEAGQKKKPGKRKAGKKKSKKAKTTKTESMRRSNAKEDLAEDDDNMVPDEAEEAGEDKADGSLYSEDFRPKFYISEDEADDLQAMINEIDDQMPEAKEEEKEKEAETFMEPTTRHRSKHAPAEAPSRAKAPRESWPHDRQPEFGLGSGWCLGRGIEQVCFALEPACSTRNKPNQRTTQALQIRHLSLSLSLQLYLRSCASLEAGQEQMGLMAARDPAEMDTLVEGSQSVSDLIESFLGFKVCPLVPLDTGSWV